MTVAVNEYGFIIDHEAHINGHLSQTHEGDGYQCKTDLFDIHCPFVMDSHFEKQQQQKNADALDIKRRKRKRKLELNIGEEEAIEFHEQVCKVLTTAYEVLSSVWQDKRKREGVVSVDNNLMARAVAKLQGFGDSLIDICSDCKDATARSVTINEHSAILQGDVVNTLVRYQGTATKVAQVLGQTCLFPANCSFLLSDVHNMASLLQDGSEYGIVVVDPPWKNKSVKRKKLYNTLDNEEICSMPVKELLAESAIVAVWVTNKQQHHRFIKDILFPSWNVQYSCTWFWLKVTQSGQLVVPLSSSHRRPYECIIIGTRGNLKCQPNNQVLISVPCACHSRKPPLFDILKRFINCEVESLELFARNLTPGVTSWGNEVLKFQHECYFQKIGKH